jgi:hypothetical protein
MAGKAVRVAVEGSGSCGDTISAGVSAKKAANAHAQHPTSKFKKIESGTQENRNIRF